MIKDYLIIDNALENPEQVRNELLGMKYFSNEDSDLPGLKCYEEMPGVEKPGGYWRGFRTADLYQSYPTKIKELFLPAFSKIFDLPYEMEVQSYGHLAPSFLYNTSFKKTSWHKDLATCIAGVVYLNNDPPKNSGTYLKINSKKIIKVENRFNRLVLYKGTLIHRPGVVFGTNIDDTRLALLIFIDKLKFFGVESGNVAEPG